jgi:hypothetical protein
VQIGEVVSPHQTLKVDVAQQLFELIFNGRTGSPYELTQALPKVPLTLTTSIRYTDWRATNQASDNLSCSVEITEKQRYFFISVERRIYESHG